MREGTGEVTVTGIKPATAFAYLADPRHTQEWFAGATLARPPEGKLHEGIAWRFVQTRSNRVVPVRMAVYEPPTHFLWRTTHHWPRTNLHWEMRCEPTTEGEAGGARLRMTIGIEPGPMGWLALWLTKPAFRPDPAMQAQRAVERARDALLERAGALPRPAKVVEKRRRRRR